MTSIPTDEEHRRPTEAEIDEVFRKAPASSLPQGVTKEVVKEADSKAFRRPKGGDLVTVDYVGTLEDGTKFDSTFDSGQPFSFTIGQTMVVHGWNVAVPTMKIGEVARFKFSPDWAYGDEGKDQIPPKATLTYEITLVSFQSKDDLFQDGGVIKTQKKEGLGWKTPKTGSELKIKLKASNKDGSVIEDKGSIEYEHGSGTLGCLSKAVDEALTTMKRGEIAILECSKDYSYGASRPDGAVLELEFEEIYETVNCSWNKPKEKSVMKKQVKEGEGHLKPKDNSKVKLQIQAAVDEKGDAIPGFVAQTLQLTVGNGDVCDALECSVLEMKKNEKAIVTTLPSLCKDEKLGLKEVVAEKVLLTVFLEELEKVPDTYSLSEEEKVAYATARKEVAGKLFREGRLILALDRYKKITDMFSYVANFKDPVSKEKAQELKKVCHLNRAACYLKLKAFREAKAACEEALKEESSNVKGLYRRAQAHLGLGNFSECLLDVKRVLEIEPQNREVRALAKEAQAGQREQDKKSQNVFGKMCNGLGKGPIPEPYKDTRFDFDFDKEDREAKAKAAEEAEAARKT